jgi:hypothetical protein
VRGRPTRPHRVRRAARDGDQGPRFVNEFEGSAVVEGTDFVNSTAQLTIQAASIDTRNSQRDEHLRSNDFLAMEGYAQITFTSTGGEQTRLSATSIVTGATPDEEWWRIQSTRATTNTTIAARPSRLTPLPR